MSLAQETVNKLLDFNQKLDIGLLDTVVGTLYSGTGDQQKMAQEVLTTLKEHPDAWTKVRLHLIQLFNELINLHAFSWTYFYLGNVAAKKFAIMIGFDWFSWFTTLQSWLICFYSKFSIIYKFRFQI